MWKNFVKDYLSFTKKDRVAVIVLVSLILLVVILPYAWPAKKVEQAGRQEIEKIRLQTAQLNKTEDAPAPETKQYEARPYNNDPAKKDNDKAKAVLFYFDPNTLDAAGWQRLGIRGKTAATIVNYLAKGGRFRRPEDLSRIYGLFKDDYERLLPYVKIASVPAVEKKSNDWKKEAVGAGSVVYPARKTVAGKTIEINRADTAALMALPGIGSKLAARIINFRDRLGGFYAVQQVGETYGLPDSTFRTIQAALQCNNPSVKQLDINTADANALKQHPYIRWNLANAIVQYRAQHGNFKSVDDLQQVAVITPEIFKKIRPYLVVAQ